MKRFPWALMALSTSMMLLSCSDEKSERRGGETSSLTTETSVQESVPERLVVREMVVQFDDATAQKLSEDGDVLSQATIARVLATTKAAGSTVAQVETMERVFPDAGEWEDRHREAGLHRFYRIRYAEPVDALRMEEELGSIPAVQSAEPDIPIKTMEGIPFNDRYAKSYQWQYYNDGTMLTGFVKGSDINVVPVWENYTGGSSNVIVSVVDEGIEMTHPDLKGITIAAGPDGSKNFCSNNYTIQAGDHGCHVGGIVAGINNNGSGICGVAGGLDGNGGVRLMSCQIFGNSSGNSADAIVWGADHGAVISQNSWGYNYDWNNDGQLTGSELQYALSAEASDSHKAAIDYFVKYAGCDKDGNQRADSPMKGGLVVFAAGNDNIRNGAPANYPSCLAVGAIGPDARRSEYSNFGSWVDICAPGGEADRFASGDAKSYILSCISGSSYGFMCGTSMACPMVSGVAALIVSYFGGPGFTATQLREILESSENREIIPSSDNIAGLVDAYRAFITAGATHENHAPVLTTDYDGDYKTIVGTDIEITYTANDQDRDEISFSLSGHASASLTTLPNNRCKVTISATEENVGSHKATLKADDGNGGIASVEISYTIKANSAPKIELVGSFNTDIKAGSTPKANFKITDPDGDAVSVALTGDKAATLVKNSAESYTVNIAATAANEGKHNATLTAKDTRGGSATYVLSYTITVVHEPIIEALSELDPKIPTGTTVSVDYKITDADGDAVTVSLDNDGSASIAKKSADTYTVTYKGEERYIGKHKATIRAVDATNLEATLEVSYEVYMNYPPQISTNYGGDYVSLVGKAALEVVYDVSDQNGDSFTVELQGDGSSSLSKLSDSQYKLVVKNTAGYAGKHTVTLKATDDKGASSTKSVSYTIVNNHAPSIKAQGSIDQEIAVGQDVSLDYSISDQDGDELDVKLTGDGSAKLSKKSEGVYTLSFVAEKSKVGDHTATITATDPYGEKATASFSYKIYVNQPPVISMDYRGPAELKWFETASATISASDPEKKAGMKFELSSDSPAISISKVSDEMYRIEVGNRQFSGTCTVKAKATDFLGASAEQSYSFTILKNRAPKLTKNFVDILMSESGDRQTYKLENYFEDPDGEDLSYKMEVIDGSSASASVSGSTAFLRAGEMGVSQIRVTATDGFGDSVETIFKVGVFNDANGPAIGPNPVKDYLTIRVGVEKDVNIRLFAEHTGRQVFEESGKASIFEPMVVDLRSLAPGRYDAKVVIGDQTYTRQIVKL